MALFPLIYPTTCATEYFGGIEINMCTWSNIKWPCSIRLSRCTANSLNILPIRWRKEPYNAFRRYFGINTMWYLHSHRVCFRLSMSFNKVSFPCDFERFTDRRLSFFTPELSNSWSPPAKLGVYLREITPSASTIIFLIATASLGVTSPSPTARTSPRVSTCQKPTAADYSALSTRTFPSRIRES